MLLACLGGPYAGGAVESPELVTDRPDQTESAEIVPRGAVQVELGWTRTWEGGGDELETTAAPGTLVRLGLHPRLEVRAAWAGRVELEERVAARTERASGAADVELGAKLLLAEERGARPRLALLAHLALPTGDRRFRSPRADPSLRVTAAHTLSPRVGLGWNAGIEAASSELPDGRVTTLTRWVYTGALGVELTARWGLFVELFGDLPASDRGRAAHLADAGITFLVTPTVQLDLSAVAGLAGASLDRSVGFGVSFRLPR